MASAKMVVVFTAQTWGNNPHFAMYWWSMRRETEDRMYQLKYQAGFEIVVVGEKCEVTKSLQPRFTGTLNQCENWLAQRGLAPIY